jgi:hypothetical protein
MIAPSATLGCPASGASRVFTPPTVAPLWAAASDGNPIDLVELYVHGPLTLIQGIFQAQGWAQALAQTIPDDLVYGISVLLDSGASSVPDWVVQRMPVSPENLCGTPSVAAMEKNNDPFAGRDHFRVFNVGVDSEGKNVWALSASLDTGLRFDPLRPKQFFINHSSEANEDLERDRVLADLQAADAVASLSTLQLDSTGHAQDNQAYSADGRVYDIVIK